MTTDKSNNAFKLNALDSITRTVRNIFRPSKKSKSYEGNFGSEDSLLEKSSNESVEPRTPTRRLLDIVRKKIDKTSVGNKRKEVKEQSENSRPEYPVAVVRMMFGNQSDSEESLVATDTSSLGTCSEPPTPNADLQQGFWFGSSQASSRAPQMKEFGTPQNRNGKPCPVHGFKGKPHVNNFSPTQNSTEGPHASPTTSIEVHQGLMLDQFQASSNLSQKKKLGTPLKENNKPNPVHGFKGRLRINNLSPTQTNTEVKHASPSSNTKVLQEQEFLLGPSQSINNVPQTKVFGTQQAWSYNTPCPIHDKPCPIHGFKGRL